MKKEIKYVLYLPEGLRDMYTPAHVCLHTHCYKQKGLVPPLSDHGVAYTGK